MHRIGHRGSNARARPDPYIVGRHHHHRQHLAGNAAQQVQHSAPEAPRCGICSYNQPYPAKGARVHHHHFSSLQLRKDAGVEASGEGYSCPSCKSRHRPYTEDRIKLVVGDSTMHEFFAPEGYTATHYKGDLVHVDYLTIKGGYIHELIEAFMLEYEHHSQAKPLDVVLVAGYADLLRGHGRDFIYEGFQHFCDRVLSVGAKIAPNAKSTVAIASLMYPPKLAWFRDNGTEPYRYENRKKKINWLNSKIDQLNLRNSITIYPGFHTYGLRVDNITTTDDHGVEVKQHTKSHRWGHWAEGPRREKFTLTTDRKFKMGQALNNYFLYRT